MLRTERNVMSSYEASKECWAGLLGWIGERLLPGGSISAEDTGLFRVTDEFRKAAGIFQQFYQKQTVLTNFQAVACL